MAKRYITKSDNFWAAAAVGGTTQWVHIGAGNTGRTRIKASTKANSGLILQNIIMNTKGTTNPVTVSDSARGIIAVLSSGSSVTEKDFHYNIPLQGDLLVDNDAAADLTVVYITP